MENILNRFSMFDFFNVLATGATFLFGLEMLNLYIFQYFFSLVSQSISANGRESNIVFIIFIIGVLFVCYMIGSIFQESCSYIQDKGFKIQDKAMKSFLTDSNVINNETRQLALKKEAAKVFNSKGILFDKENITPEQNHYFYAYCVYFIQIRGLDEKTEKMRTLHGISGMLSLCFFVLSFIGFFRVSYLCIIDNNLSIPLFVTFIAYIILSIIFWYRMKKDIYYRIRMVAGIYEVASDREKNNIQLEPMQETEVMFENDIESIETV